MKIGFIGLGIMGSRMAANLVNAGLDVTVFNRSRGKSEELEKIGASIGETIASAAGGKNIVITMLSTPDAAGEVARGGLVDNLDKDCLWIDCTTVDPVTTLELAGLVEAGGASFMDAPVAGSLKPAENGELVFLAGGSKENFKKAEVVFEIMGKKAVHAGDIGQGSAMKLVVNSMLGAGLAAFKECLVLGKSFGFDRETIFSVLDPLPVTPPMIAMKKSRVLAGDYSPEFPLQWMFKDLILALKMAEKNGIEVPLIKKTEEAFKEAMDKGLGGEDVSAVLKQ